MLNCELSFIIPTLNEEEHIGGVIDAIAAHCDQNYRYEIIVVDNGSSDRTTDIALAKGAKCLSSPRCTISTVRNRGASEAGSDILVFLDADVYLGKDWGKEIKRVIEKINCQPDIVTGSLYGISEENNWIERIWFAPRMNQKEINYINGGHLIMHRNLFSRIGGFDPEMETGEDYEFCIRARKMGARIENDPELKVIHAGYPKSIKRFFARERWHARGDYKSISTLISSKPAVLSLANLCLIAICVIGIIFSSLPWYTSAGFYIISFTGMSLASTIHRFRGEINSGLLCAVFLYMVYFTARTISLIDILTLSTKKLFSPFKYINLTI